MSSVSRATGRRLSYASGYLGLGLFQEAAGELKAIIGAERDSAEFLAVQSDLLMTTKQWKPLATTSEQLARRDPSRPTGWINWAYALRELEQVAEAKAVLLRAEAVHPNLDILHYNLACYHCLLGEMKEAKRRLQKACRMDQSWKSAAASDPDLSRLREG